MSLKQFLRAFVPAAVLSAYHLTLAHLAAAWYGYPSEKLIVIGVTGTKGKSTTSSLIAQLFEMTGHRVGLTSTATMKIGNKEWLNDMKMTMPGRFTLQKLLRQMVQAGCEVAVVETSSEGLAQHRHIGIHYDTAVFTNLSPEHIESHGSYEAYRHAKSLLFSHLKQLPIKVLNGRPLNKTVVLNRDDAESAFFATIGAGDEWCFGLTTDDEKSSSDHEVVGKITSFRAEGMTIECRGLVLRVPLIGKVNAYNTLAAATTLLSRGVPFAHIAENVSHLAPVPGRQEFISEGQPFTVVVDYAYEPTSIAELYSLLAVIPYERLIHVLGPTGGGRDTWRRPVMGELAAHHADVVIGTTDDPYDDDPAVLVDQMIQGANKVRGEGRIVDVRRIIDRREAIRTALTLAGEKDLVLITGKGAEQTMAVASGQYIPWDDRQVVREEIRSMKKE